MKRLAIRCKTIYTDDGPVDGILRIEGNRINKIVAEDSLQQDGFLVEDYTEAVIIPGIIDCHNHGYAGWQADSHDPNEILSYAKALASVGVTGVLATVGGDEESLMACAAAMKSDSSGAEILGIHMEGPFLNICGAAEKSQLRNPDCALTEKFLKAGEGAIKYMTLAPELPGAKDVIRQLVAEGIVVGAGHTTATAEEFENAVDEGVSVSVHTGNAMRGIHHREIGTLGAALLDERIHCELIADFFHVCKDMITLMLKVKDQSMFHLVSDSTLFAGIEPGIYGYAGGKIYVERNGLVHLENGTIAGSSKNVLYGIKNMMKIAGLDFTAICKMASYNPARILRIADRKGSIAVGKDADFVILDRDRNVLATFVGGKKVFDSFRDTVNENPVVTKNKIGNL